MIDKSRQQEIRAYLEDSLPQYLSLLKDMVDINSFTENPSGINELGQLTADSFASLGFAATIIQSVNPNYGKHLVMTKIGSSGRKIGMVSHLDTVFSAAEEAEHDFVWREQGDRIYGPGTVDIKGGTVLIYMVLSALKVFAPTVFNSYTWIVLLDASEERGGFDFMQLCLQELGAEAAACLVFEGGHFGQQQFNIVTARKGMAFYKIKVDGRSAHAGNAHESGANAIVQMADVVQRVAALTNYEQNITFNVGTISGGTVTNRVPHYAEAAVEMRAFSPEIFEQGIADMLAFNDYSSVSSASEAFPCKVTVELVGQMNPWPRNPQTERLLDIWQRAAQAIDLTATPEERGGLSDGNGIWHEIATLDGLGPSGGNMHCAERSADGLKDQEYVERSSFVPKALLNTIAILQLAEIEAS